MKRGSRIHSLIANENSFDKLFCDTNGSNPFTLFYNTSFVEDPIFNHVVLNSSSRIFQNPDSRTFEQILTQIASAAKNKGVPASIFVDRYLGWAERFEISGVDHGYRIAERMNIMSKQVSKTNIEESSIEVAKTRNIKLWNRVFVASYDIPRKWERELLRREESFLDNSNTTLLLAHERDSGLEASGCLLLRREPKDWMGVYCVGTLPERRSKGVAAALMKKAETVALERKCKFLTLQTIESDGVTPMYLKMGYHIDFNRDIMQSA